MFSWLSWQNPVALWWVALATVASANIAFWVWTWYFRFRSAPLFSRRLAWNLPSHLIWYSAVYAFVCAFRSWLPRADVQRICLFDTWWSSVFVGRTLATVAELSFVAQWAVVIGTLARLADAPVAERMAKWFLPLIVVAEICSWYAVVRTHYLGNVIEESLWAVTYTLVGFSLVALLPRLKGALRLAAQFAVGGCILYVIFMVTVDVPMYVRRLLEDNAANKPLLGLWEGLVDLNTRWVVTHNILDWKSEIPWQTLYFTVAVWTSLALCYVPLSKDRLGRYLR